MQQRNIIVRSLFFGIFVAFTILSCTKASGPVMNYAIPTADSIKLSLDGQSLSVSWAYPASGELDGFAIQIAQDDAFKKLIVTDTVSKDDRTYISDSSGFLDAYYVRILAIATDIARSSEYGTQSLNFENIAQPVADADITGNSAKISWTAPFSGAVSALQIYPDNADPLPAVTLNATDISNKQYTITGLSVSTHYTVLLLDGTTRKGRTGFKTKATAD